MRIILLFLLIISLVLSCKTQSDASSSKESKAENSSSSNNGTPFEIKTDKPVQGTTIIGSQNQSTSPTGSKPKPQ